jgi:hypothetical protein
MATERKIRPARRRSARDLAPRAAARALVLAACWMLHPSQAAAQTPGEKPESAPAGSAPSEEKAPAWAGSVAGNAYIFPGKPDFGVGVARADGGKLHLEARWNYEAQDTGSLWAGWNYSTGKSVTLDVTPMLGAVIGDTDGIAPGVELSLAWKQLDFYTETELVYDLDSAHDSFVYSWTEGGYSPAEWVRVGIVGQRTRLYDTGLDVQRGIFGQVIFGRTTLGVYWFNPGGGPDTFSVALLDVKF